MDIMQNFGETEFDDFSRPMPTAQIGRQLAMIGDDINSRYETQFNHMIRSIMIGTDTETFAGFAQKLFRDGNITCGRIITLLCFGYRLAVTVIRGLFANIIGFVAKFIVTAKLTKWIAEQGGWFASLRYIPETVGWPTLGAVVSVCLLSVCATRLFSVRTGRRRHGNVKTV